MYVPSPVAVSVEVAYGVPAQEISSVVANGPHSSTWTGALRAPSPVTTTLSVIDAPGAVYCALTWVVICGRPRTIVVSAVSAHGVCTGRTNSLAAIDSRYV